MRVKFDPSQQRIFLDYVKKKVGLSLRKIAKVNKLDYECLKKYHQEKCFISEDSFIKLCKIAKINPSEIEISYLEEHWGQIKGGNTKR